MLSRPGTLKLLAKEFSWLETATASFNQRKVLQKTVFILQEMRLRLGYQFNWYLYGPYSPQLAEDAYQININGDYLESETHGYSFSSKSKDILRKFKSLFADRKTDETWLEIVSSLLFLKKYYHYSDHETLLKQLLNRKPKFRRQKEIVEEAILFLEGEDFRP